ncbi:protein odr-4 homolog [Sinocyclocheilus grahami]|uniref:protein odr-4 homolog n=1 Tax=Sinocyclocheilus grahami TaxID=75366 RepID=UPI0007ACF836|nr:PREDICTED: protein odr-4 homolog [Sinocyclocheilus grahami]
MTLMLEWVTEHAKQVSRMLPGGLCILGLFLVTPPELSKDAQNALKRLVFAMDKYITTVCKTFDVKDPQSSAKPADWKYQTGVSSSWPMLICSVEVDVQILVSSDITDKCMKDGLRRWAEQIEAAYCLINGRQALDDSELSSGQKKNPKTTHRQTLPARIFVTDVYQCHRNSQSWMSASSTSSALVQVCSGSVKVRGVVYCRAYIHNNKPKARHAAQAIKRGIINTVCSRVEMFLEDLLINEGSHKGLCSGQQALPRRVFAPVPISGLSVCDYMFPDESTADVAERLKEMLDCETPEEDIDTGLEGNQLFSDVSGSEITDSPSDDSSKHVISEVQAENPKNQKAPQYYAGVAVTAVIALLATATSLLYFNE